MTSKQTDVPIVPEEKELHPIGGLSILMLDLVLFVSLQSYPSSSAPDTWKPMFYSLVSSWASVFCALPALMAAPHGSACHQAQ